MASNPQKLDALIRTKNYLTKSNPYGLEIQKFNIRTFVVKYILFTLITSTYIDLGL